MENQSQQEMFLRLSVLEQQMQYLQQQLDAVEKGINQLQTLDLDLNEIQGANGKEILAQIGTGIYVPAKLLSETLTVNIGENNFVKKSVSETKKIIQSQIKKLQETQEELEQHLDSINHELLDFIQNYQRESSENSSHEHHHGHSHEHSDEE
ncbi:MAG TPA: prefoldin subunit alpha [Candidatus Pacearchaeota archaeon]|nr:prefoldin subunit alpha [Candidatus Pacearchaeota archaeon]